MSTYKEKITTTTLPVITTKGLINFPMFSQNFEISEEDSLNVCKKVIKNKSEIFLVSLKDISKSESMYSVGTIGRITHSINSADGMHIIINSTSRATALKYFKKSHILYADLVQKEISQHSNDILFDAMKREILDLTNQLIEYNPNISRDLLLAAETINDAGFLADFIANNILFEYKDKQEVLNEYDPQKRLSLLANLIYKEKEILHTEVDIHSKVKENIDNSQRDYYLREQLKVIENELDDTANDEIEKYEKSINSLSISKDSKEKLMKEVTRLGKAQFSSPDASTIRNYLDTCLTLPWEKYTKDNTDIYKAKKQLDKDHYGLEKQKDRILDFLAVKHIKKDAKNQVLCFIGPPGTGKTSICKSIAKAMNRKYAHVSLGGVHDESEIRGHRKTYIGSMPGRIIDAISQAKSSNPLIVLDEIDKMSPSYQGDPSSALLEVLDDEQNDHFVDHYIEVPFDLSNCQFICTANSYEDIPSPLYDRMEIIEFNTYTKTEKINIAKEYIFDKELRKNGLTKRNIKIDTSAYNSIIDRYTKESGVRELSRQIATICRKSIRRMIEDSTKSVTITSENIKDFLGPYKFDEDEGNNEIDRIGVVNGLAYTSVGGEMLKIETAVMDGSGKLELTGSLGDVMKESAKIAMSYIRVHSDELGIEKNFYKKKDIHIHVPEGAVPKDGPSAGISILTSMVSALSNTEVNHNVAMTGELTLTGNVLPIGGLREKTTAAYNNRKSTVIIPQKNKNDIPDIDKDIISKLNIVYCSDANDVLREALIHK